MADSSGTAFNLKALALPPDDLLPKGASSSIFSRLWSAIAPRTMPAARPTVGQPTAFPYGSVALLEFYDSTPSRMQFLGDGTGFFVKPDLLLTAAHSLYYSGANMVAIYPAWDTRLNRSPVIAGLRWCQSTSRDVSVVLTQPRGKMTVTIGGSGSPVGTLVGYAFNYPDGTRRMSQGAGKVSREGHLVTYPIAAQQRDSGAPIFSTGNVVMGLHRDLVPAPNGSMVGRGEAIDPEFIGIVSQLEVKLRGH